MKKSRRSKALAKEQQAILLGQLEGRFQSNMRRHKSLRWANVETRLLKRETVLWTLSEMERTGGEPDVIGLDKQSGKLIFCDCSEQTPGGRTSLCYDQVALDSRKANKPIGSAVEMAKAIGIELLTEQRYRLLQKLGEFDTKTSSWIETPDDIRCLGGALFCDRRFGHVFVYHNGADSYFAARGFRGSLLV